MPGYDVVWDNGGCGEGGGELGGCGGGNCFVCLVFTPITNCYIEFNVTATHH